MPYRHQLLINGEIYHIVSRGIDDNLIFKNADDYYRGIFSIYEFNNAKPVEIYKRCSEIQSAKKMFKKQGRGERVSSMFLQVSKLGLETLLFFIF